MEYNEHSIMNMHISARNPNRKNAHKGGSVPLISQKYCYTLETGQPHYVLVTPKLTSTQSQHINNTLEDTQTMETQRKSTQENSQTLTSWWEDFHAKLSPLLENEKDLTTPEGHYFLTSLGFSQKKDPDIWYSKTSKVYLVTTQEKLSRQSLGFLPTWGISWNGRYLTAKTSEFPKTGSVCSLSDILEENPDEKYFLSSEQTEKILSNSINQSTPTTESTQMGGVSPTLNTMQGGRRQPFVMKKIDRSTQTYEIKDTETAGTLTSTMWKGINALGRTGVKELPRIRRLTPVECERLQGFPDNWTVGSDTQRYKQCGNAVTVNVVEAVIANLREDK